MKIKHLLTLLLTMATLAASAQGGGIKGKVVSRGDRAAIEQVKITLGPKGFGSENMSAIRMFKPSAGLQGIKDFILETVEAAGPNPCPPIVVGVGIGGTFDKAALLAKKALMRPLDTRNPDPFYADLEKEMLEKVNALGIGPQGFGGRTTAIGLNIETMPTHIAGMPGAININCHETRHKTEVL